MPATTISGMINALMTFKNNEVFWFIVGRTQTPWASESSPPAEVTTTTTLEEIGGLQKAQTVSLCYPDPNGAIQFRGQNYSLVNDANAYSYSSNYIYLSTMLMFDQFPIVTFRQYGIQVGVVPTTGNESKSTLTPTQVQSYGELIGYVNIPPIIRTVGSKNLLEIVLSFVPEVTT
jgi:hypothetical protein